MFCILARGHEKDGNRKFNLYQHFIFNKVCKCFLGHILIVVDCGAVEG